MLAITSSPYWDEGHLLFCLAACPFCCVTPFCDSSTLIWRWRMVPTRPCMSRCPPEDCQESPLFSFSGLSGYRIKVIFPSNAWLLTSAAESQRVYCGLIVALHIWKRRLWARNVNIILQQRSSEPKSRPIWLAGSTESPRRFRASAAPKIPTCFLNCGMSQRAVNFWGQRWPLIILNKCTWLRNDGGSCTVARAPRFSHRQFLFQAVIASFSFSK